MKLQNLTVIFIIIILPIILLVSAYISTGLKTIRYQAIYDTGLITATQDAIQAFEKNSLKNTYSDNAEVKRSIIMSSVKMFERSLSNNCNISSYNTDEIEEYIPAIVFGMKDGFYMYTPSFNPKTSKYEHSLKNYVYYSETLNEDKSIVIRYYLDSYVQISGYFDDEGTTEYQSKEGYLINTDVTKFEKSDGTEISAKDFYDFYKAALDDDDDRTMPSGTITYYGTEIDIADQLAVNYFVDNYIFSDWFNNTVISNIDINTYSYLKISDTNDPEDPNSEFVQHKNKIIRDKIEGVLNSTITAYSKRTWNQNYKMPKLSEEDWEKILSDISVTTFFQGKKIGFSKYNGYCVLNSNNHYELINPNLLYFSTDDGGETTGVNTPDKKINTTYDYYHDIRCNQINQIDETDNISIEQATKKEITTIRGWRVGRFNRKTMENEDGTTKYTYERKECACYDCINGSITNNVSVYDYINVATSNWSYEGHANKLVTESYWTSLARERAKLHEDKTIPSNIAVTKYVKKDGTYINDNPITVINGGKVYYKISITNNADKIEYIEVIDFVKGVDLLNNIDIDRIEILNTETKIVIGRPRVTDANLQAGYDMELGPGETIDIYYKANITDRNGDSSVTNMVEVYNDIDSEPKDDEETCNTTTSILDIEKVVKQGGVIVSKVNYGSEVLYEINIKNLNTDMDDIVNITDSYDPSQIKNIRNISFEVRDKNGTVVLRDPPRSPSTGNIAWEYIDIPAGGSIKITFKANLEAPLGREIINTAEVVSTYTETSRKADTSTCIMETEVRVAKLSASGRKEIMLILDTSVSMTAEAGLLRDTANKFMKDVVDGEIGEVVSVIQFGAFANKKTIYYDADGYGYIRESLITAGTRYDFAWDLAYKIIIEDEEIEPDVIIFFSDGYSTWADGMVPVYPIEGSREGYWNDGLVGDIGIITQLDRLASRGISIFSVGLDAYGDFEKTLGIIPRNGGTAEQVEGISNIFDTILPALSSEIDVADSYESENGIIKDIKYIDNIVEIQIGSERIRNTGSDQALDRFKANYIKNEQTVTEAREDGTNITYKKGDLYLKDIPDLDITQEIKIVYN